MKTYILCLALMVMGAVLGVHAVEVEPVKHGNMIRGHVIEKDSEEHLPYATILIVETGEGLFQMKPVILYSRRYPKVTIH